VQGSRDRCHPAALESGDGQMVVVGLHGITEAAGTCTQGSAKLNDRNRRSGARQGLPLERDSCANIGVAALPGYVCQAELRAGALRQILPEWMAADARITALIPYRTGLLPAVRTLVDYLAVVMPKVTAFDRS